MFPELVGPEGDDFDERREDERERRAAERAHQGYDAAQIGDQRRRWNYTIDNALADLILIVDRNVTSLDKPIWNCTELNQVYMSMILKVVVFK